ncbi:Ser-Thr-rich GPI-anchored membrane family protein [Rhodoflexus sp.]
MTKQLFQKLMLWALLLTPVWASAQAVTLTSPNGGENITAGSTVNITFTFIPASIPANDVFVLELLAGGELYQTLTPSAITASPFVWNVPATIASRNDYRIRIRRATASAETDQSDNNFTITGGRSITITQPNGGQALQKPTITTITWTSTNLPPTENVRIELLRGGSVQAVLFASTPNDGTELWNVAADLPDDANYRIRISSVADPFVRASSAFDFIIGRVLLLEAPNGGERWQRGTTQNIRWLTSIPGNFRIELLKAGVVTASISTGTGLQTFPWTIPNNLPDGDDYRVRLTNNSDNTISVTSANNFTIGNFLILNAPATGANVLRGANFNITWETNLTGNLRIELLRGAVTEVLAASVPAANGTFTWTVANTLPEGNDYRIRLTSLDTTPEYVATSGNFSIAGPFGRIVSPNGGEVFNRTRNFPIIWQSNLGGNVNIDLVRAGTVVQNLATSIPNNGNFDWLIAPTVTPANNYRIRITFLANNSSSESAANFEILADPVITVQTPNGGETFFRTRSHAIVWTDNIPENVNIDLFRGGNFLRPIATNVASNGNFQWTVPADVPVGNNYRVRVRSAQDSLIRDLSDNDFAIANNDTIRVTAPNGGEAIVRGTTFTIRWQTNITQGNVIIELLQNNNLLGVVNPSVPAAQGSFTWIAPVGLGIGQEGYRIRVRTEDNRATDVSDNDFRLLAQQFSIITPSGGQQLFLGFGYDITWVTNLPGNVRIDLFRGSVSLRTIADNVTGNIFRWVVPTDLPPSSDYRIRITNLGDETRFTETVGFIELIRPTITVLTPNGGEAWFSNNFRYNITWQDNLNGEPVRIDLLRGGVVLQNIATSVTGGTFNWTLPDNLTTGTDYRVRISAVGAPTFFDDSNADFRITRPEITVTSPAAGVTWFRTLSYNIVWQSNLGNLLHRIELVNADGTLVREIASSVENSGTFNRLITPDFPLGTNFRVRVSVATNSAVFGLSNGVFSIAVDNIPPVISNTNFPTVLDLSQTIESIAPTITATDNVGIQRVICFFKGITQDDNSFRQRDAVLTDNVYRAFIASGDFDELGVEYFFEVIDRSGNTTRSQRGYTYVRYSSSRGLLIPDIRFGQSQEAYQIISVPLNLDNRDALAVLENELGQPDRLRWRLFHYENGQNLEYPQGFRNIVLGRGYWLIVREPWAGASNSIDTGPGDGARNNQANPFVMNLQQGWNQIASPYNFNISWNDVRAANNNPNGLGRLRTFDGNFRDEDVLRRFRGGFVFADRPLSVNIPVLKNRSINSGRLEAEDQTLRNPLNSGAWDVQLRVRNGELVNTLGGFGMRPDAAELKDDYDDMTLPRFADYLEVNFLRTDYFYPKFTKDVVPTAGEYVWEFSIETNRTGGNISIEWDNSYFGSSAMLFLYDREAQRYVDMSKTNRYTFRSEQAAHRFRVIYGDWNFVQRQMNVEQVSFQVWPNPAHSQANLDFALPDHLEGANVQLSIVNAMGQQVFSEGKQYRAGFHTRTWDRNAAQLLAKGVYLCRLEVSHPSLDKPMVVLRRLVIE